MSSRIDAGQIPSPTTDAAAVVAAAGAVRGAGSAVDGAGTDLKASWQGLSSCYEAPEVGQLLGVMDPVAALSAIVGSEADTIASALSTFAAETGPLVATLAATKANAQAFHNRTDSVKNWDHDQSLVDENNRYVHAVDTAVVAFEAAERKCANAIEGLFGGVQWHAVDAGGDASTAYGNASIPDNADTPWGKAATVHRSCGAATAHAITTFATDPAARGRFFGQVAVGIGKGLWDTVKGLSTLVNVSDPVAMGQAWMGIGTLLGARGPQAQRQAEVAMGKGKRNTLP